MISYTNNPRDYKRAVRFYREAIADGWQPFPTYQHESEEKAARLHREGWVVLVLMRTREDDVTGCWEYDAGVEALGPDRLPVRVPLRYDWAALQRGLRCCSVCGVEDVKTVQWNWRQRTCEACYKKLTEELYERQRQREVTKLSEEKAGPERSADGLFAPQ